MKIKIIEKNYDVGNRLRDLITKKLSKLDKYFYEEPRCEVYCKEDNQTFSMEINISAKKAFYRSEVKGGKTMFENLDIALPKIERQIIRNNQIRVEKYREQPIEDMTPAFLEEKPEFKDISIVKTKKFDLEPISVEDAKVFMENSDHDFYVFLNRTNAKVNILYKRKDDQLGLIEANF